MPLVRISKPYLRTMRSYIHHVSSRKQMVWSAWVIEESLIKGLYTKTWAALRKPARNSLAPRDSNNTASPPCRAQSAWGRAQVTGISRGWLYRERDSTWPFLKEVCQPQGNVAERLSGLNTFLHFNFLTSCKCFSLVKCPWTPQGKGEPLILILICAPSRENRGNLV